LNDNNKGDRSFNRILKLKSDFENRIIKEFKQASKSDFFTIKDYFHKTTRFIVNYLVSNNIDTLVVGYNKEWKQNANLGKTGNQNFVYIPFYKFKEILKYKCEEAGIRFIVNEESYTSKCSFLDEEAIEKHDSYVGKRIKRGLFRTASGRLINADTDINGSLNILKKAVPSAFSQGIVGVVVHPVIIKIAK
jgi:putative transposase